MLFWKILGALLVLLLLLLALRVGVEAAFGEGETRVTLRVGPFRFRLLPRKKKQRPTKEKPTPKQPSAGDKPADRPKLGWNEWKCGAKLLLPALKKALGRTRRAIRIDPLRLHLVIGGDDPAAVGQSYGYAQALLWTLMPQAELLLRIPDPHIRLDADFDGGATRCQGEVGMGFRIGSMARISLALLPPLLKWLRLLRAAKKTTAAAQPADGSQTAPAETVENAAAEAAAPATERHMEPPTDGKGEHYGE